MDLDFSDEFSVLQEMQEDYGTLPTGVRRRSTTEIQKLRKRENSFLTPLSQRLPAGIFRSIKMTDTTEGQVKACEYLIGSFDENGFPPPHIGNGLLSELPLRDHRKVKNLQSFDPVGIVNRLATLPP